MRNVYGQSTKQTFAPTPLPYFSHLLLHFCQVWVFKRKSQKWKCLVKFSNGYNIHNAIKVLSWYKSSYSNVLFFYGKLKRPSAKGTLNFYWRKGHDKWEKEFTYSLRCSKVQILVIVKDMFILFLVKPFENLLQIKDKFIWNYNYLWSINPFIILT